MTSSRPNILWICTDQQRYDTLGCYNNEYVETPAIDGLAESGVRFERAYSQSPVCTPSRVSVLTGRYPRTTRCRQNGQPVPDDEVFVTQLLAESGYRTGLAGKLHVSPVGGPPEYREPARRIDDGYEVFEWSHRPGTGQENAYGRWLSHQDIEYDLSQVPESEYVSETVPSEHHQTMWCADRAVDFIETAGDDPWLYSVNMFDPHPPYGAPPDYLDRYRDRLDDLPDPKYTEGELEDKPQYQREKHEGTNNRGGPPYVDLERSDHLMIRAAYFAMCDLIDDAVARLLAALERTDQREDTIVLFTSDHGTMLGDHGLYAKGPYFYEGAIRVPLIVDGPAIEGDRAIDDIVELVDIAPTLLTAANESIHPGMQGESLWPLLKNEGSYTKESAYCEFYNASTQHTDPEVYATMIRSDRYKLVAVHGQSGGELYDLQEDPRERTNHWSDPEYQAEKVRLLDRLTERMARTTDPLPERRAPW